MLNLTEGFYHYIDKLYYERQLNDPYVNQVINQRHRGYCFSIKPYVFLPSTNINNIQNRRFFNDFRFKEHHLSIEKNEQFGSTIHYTCCFEKIKNQSEILKFSVFFDQKDHQKITRVSYRYLTTKIHKGDIPLKSSPKLDVFKFISLVSQLPIIHESITFEQLTKIALDSLKYRLSYHLHQYNLRIQSKLQLFNHAYAKYLPLSQQLQQGNKDITTCQNAYVLLEDTLLAQKEILAYVQTKPSVKSLTEQKTKLKDTLIFANVDNLSLIQELGKKREMTNPLLKQFEHLKISPEHYSLAQISHIYETAILAGVLDLSKYIFQNFFFIDYFLFSRRLLDVIEKAQDAPRLSKQIEVSNFLFEFSVSHQHAVMERLQLRTSASNTQHQPQMDILVKMFLNYNFQAFLMYLNFTGQYPTFDLNHTLEKLKSIAAKATSDNPYIEAIEQKLGITK